MEIRTLELENVKSYERETIVFGRGINAICGPNGAGKSTIIEAIGYALFAESPARRMSSWVREGAKTATVTVTLLANDEREYQVVRKCGSQSQYYIYDPELKQRVADKAEDVADWLRGQLGVEDSADLSALFRDAVGVPQGLFTAAFLQTASNRRAVFDPLLRVEEYNQAFANLLEARHTLEQHSQELAREMAGLEAQVRDLPRLEAEADELAERAAAAEARLQALAPALQALSAQKDALEAARDRLRVLSEQAARLDERAGALAAGVEQAARRAEQAREAARILAECEPGHRAYLAAQAARHELEAQEAARAQARQAVMDCRAEQQLRADRAALLERDVAEARAARDEAMRLAPAARAQEALEHELTAAQALAEQAQAVQERLAGERRRLSQLRERLQAVEAALEERRRLEAERTAQEQAQEELEEAVRALRDEEARQEALLNALREQSAALDELDAPQCPVCESELSAERREALLDRNRQQQAEGERQLDALHAQLNGLALQVRAAQKALRSTTAALARLPRPEEREALAGDVARQEAAVAAAEQEAQSLAEAGSRARDLQRQLAELGDVRTQEAQALARATREPQLAAQAERERAQAEALSARLADLEQALQAYAQLDEALNGVRAELAAQEPAHRLYLQHEREAAELPAREAQQQAQQAALASVEQEREALAAELAAAQAAYHRDEADRVTAAFVQASEERSRLETQVRMQRDQLEATQERIAELRALAERLQTARKEMEGWRELAVLLEYLRKLLKEAGPQVTRALVEVISQQAARLYADIISDSTSRLRWSEDYEILLECGGHERAFAQLSGGEEMAAALAVRLALLREISDVDIAFFDEPTTNLDDTRRDNLAEQILGIKGFSQLFVVSHDDTFERATDHVVRIAKVDGVSRVRQEG